MVFHGILAARSVSDDVGRRDHILDASSKTLTLLTLILLMEEEDSQVWIIIDSCKVKGDRYYNANLKAMHR